MSAPDTKPPASPAPETWKESGFLTRWSRRKRAAETGQPLPEPAPPPTAPAAPAAAPVAAVDLPDPTTLGFDDDFSAYLGAQVPAALKRAAMAKLFADPSFNKMDGLDTYIEDYNLVADLPAAERDLLAHVREVLSQAPTADCGAPPATEPSAQATAETEVPDAVAITHATLDQAVESDDAPDSAPTGIRFGLDSRPSPGS